jgi:hypothetical protein
MLTSFTRWFLLWFLATVVLLCLGLGIRVAAATEEAGGTPATNPGSSPTVAVIVLARSASV